MANVSQADVDAILDKAKKDIDALWVVPPVNPPIHNNLQLAINKALVGDTINLASDFSDGGPIIVTKPLKIIGDGAAQLSGGISIPAPNVTLASLNSSKVQSRDDIVLVYGDNVSFLNVNIKGSAALGQKRGIAANCKGMTLKNVKVSDIWLTDQDAQAVAGWDGMIDFVADDCMFSAAGETFLVGGADAQSSSRQPQNIKLTRCLLTKDIKWKTVGIQVKNNLELKNVIGFTADDCTIEYSWQSAQNGFLIVLTPRNQDGNNPWACVKGVTINNCKGGHAAALCSMLRTDDEKPSGILDNVKFTNNQFDDINPATWMTSGNWWDHNDQIFLVGGSPSNVTIDKNTITGDHIGSGLYFYQDNQGPRKSTNFNFTNNKSPKSKYGTPSVASPWNQFVASGQLSGNSEV